MSKRVKISIYQVLPRLFGNRTASWTPGGTIRENGCGKLNGFTATALRSIRELGITHVWYTGLLEHATRSVFKGIPSDPSAIVKGEAGSPYAIRDYYDISPTLATSVSKRMEEFERLVQRTHDADMGVIIDFVPNHVARSYGSDAAPDGVDDFGAGDDTTRPFAPTNNFYYIPGEALTIEVTGNTYTETPARATGNDHFSAHPGIHDWYETVKLNYGVDYLGGRAEHFSPLPDTWIKMREILLYWSAKGVDGFRCDMAEMVPVAFWRWAIGEVRSKYPRILFIAEIYQPHLYEAYLEAGFDYLYDKVGLYDTLIGVLRGERPASDISAVHHSQEMVKGRMLRFMENHDEVRLASDFVVGSGAKAFPAMVVSALLGTTDGVMTYFGQELGERGMDAEGYSGRDGRTSIFDYCSLDCIRRWRGERGSFSGNDLTEVERSLRDSYRTLLNTALGHEALRSGKFFDLMYVNHKPGIDPWRDYLFLRSTGEETILVAVNFADAPHSYEVTIPEHAFEVLGIEDHKPCIVCDLLTGRRGIAMLSSRETVAVTIPPHGALVLRFSEE